VTYLSKSKEYEINKMQNNVTRALPMPNPPFVENLETNLKMLHSKMNIDERYRVPSDQF